MVTLRSLMKALRPHQWLKNVLVFVAPLAAHRFDWDTATALFLAFASFSLCASGGYVLNDLIDLGADRQHARKKHRPFAAGTLSKQTGVLLLVASWSAGLGIAALLRSPEFLILTLTYLAATSAYSIWLKRVPALDVMVLAGLYVIRVIIGGAATNVPVSTWLLAFTMFISLSLAFLKRFIEVQAHVKGSSVPGRAYVAADAAWLHSVGLSSAYLAAVVLAIYANSADVTKLYDNPERLLLLCPILLYWATRVWLNAHRNNLHDDPVVAVAADRVTYIIGAISIAILFLAI